VNLGFLTGKALTGPKIDVFGHAGPEEARSDQTAGGPNAWMAKTVNMVKNLTLECQGDKGTESVGGVVSKQGQRARKGNGRKRQRGK
jgi:hypothetical protein